MDKKALDIVLINMKKMSNVCGYFVITSGASTTQVRAIADHIIKKLKERKQRLWHSEGAREALWIVLDYSDVVVHVFLDETRRFYDLERLWGDAPQERFEEAPPARTPSARRARRPKLSKRRAKAPSRRKRTTILLRASTRKRR